jgi:hypothetical protein
MKGRHYPTDDELLEEILLARLDDEAEALMEAVIAAEEHVFIEAPSLLAALDANAEACWAEIPPRPPLSYRSGVFDLKLEEQHIAAARERRGPWLTKMVNIFLERWPTIPWQGMVVPASVMTLYQAVRALWTFVAVVDPDYQDHVEGYLTDIYGDRMYRYLL